MTRYRFDVTFTADEYALNLSTQSYIKKFPPDIGAELINRIRRRVIERGGTINAHLLATLTVARTRPIGSLSRRPGTRLLPSTRLPLRTAAWRATPRMERSRCRRPYLPDGSLVGRALRRPARSRNADREATPPRDERRRAHPRRGSRTRPTASHRVGGRGRNRPGRAGLRRSVVAVRRGSGAHTLHRAASHSGPDGTTRASQAGTSGASPPTSWRRGCRS